MNDPTPHQQRGLETFGFYWEPNCGAWIDLAAAVNLFGYEYADALRDNRLGSYTDPTTRTQQVCPLPLLGLVDHRCGFDNVRPSGGERDGGALPCASGGWEMNTLLYRRGSRGYYRGYPAVVLDHSDKEFIVSYKRDDKWTIFSGAAPEEFHAVS